MVLIVISMTENRSGGEVALAGNETVAANRKSWNGMTLFLLLIYNWILKTSKTAIAGEKPVEYF